MPSFSKKVLSLFLRNGCERQFVLYLYKDVERRILNMPPRQQNRAGLGLVGQAGYKWQDEKVAELTDIFGPDKVHVNPTSTARRPSTLDLLTILPKVQAYQFIVEAAYIADTPSFRSAVGLTNLIDYFGNAVNISETHPDIIQVLPPFSNRVGRQTDSERNLYSLGVGPDGGTFSLNLGDNRLRLRVIDIKLTSEPGAHYFAEVVYYSMTLAAWLIEQGLDDRFVVVAAPAVWPGSHEASNLAKQSTEWSKKAYQPTALDIASVLEKDIEVASFDVFAPRLRRFLSEQLPSMLSRPWEDLSWHVDFRCKGCEFLGYPWRDKDGNVDNVPSQCWPAAEALGHLSRVVGLSRGASEYLRNSDVRDVISLAATSASSQIFNEHQGLRAKRTTFPHRAIALQSNTTSIIPSSGGDALMPRWPDLHVYVFLDYDLSSAITASIALRAFWMEPFLSNPTLERQRRQWTQRQGEDEVFLVDSRRIERERNEFLKFLRQLRKIFSEVTQQDVVDTQANRRDQKNQHSTYQIYLWDESQRKHLVRLVSRHLSFVLADPQLRDLAWLFPPPELLQHAEDATRQSPITLVSSVIDNTVAVPVPHYHRLLDVVETYKSADVPVPSVHPLYEEPMSDLIPAERIHEWWQRKGRWQDKQDSIAEATRKKAYAMNLIVSRLEQDLKQVLSRQAAPPLARAPRAISGIAPQSRLWLEYSRLNAALDSLDVHTIRSMPPHEREARLKSARLTLRLSGQEEQDALFTLGHSLGRVLSPDPGLFVYKMRDGSREVNLRPGDFTYALAPETRYGFLDEHPFSYIKGTSLEGQFFGKSTIGDAAMTAVTIEAIDRVNSYIALRAGPQCCVQQLERETNLDFSHNVILDPVHRDYLTSKVELTVRGIGHPASAVADQRTLEALGLPPNIPLGTSVSTPAAEVLWETPSIHLRQTARNVADIRSRLQTHFDKTNTRLDPSQWSAWEEALSRSFTLLWGPPGTGKSRTLRAVVMGAVIDSLANAQHLRLLVTANTYTALDNVLLELERELKSLLPGKPYDLYRIQSKWQPVSPELAKYPDLTNLLLNTATPSPEIMALRKRLEKPSGIVIVGCLPQQLHNLSITGNKRRNPRDTIRSWFDLIVLDEASQIDVASTTLVFSKLVAEGSCVLAGDDLQLPPIQQADPPEDLEHVVGSAYNYFRHHHGIIPSPLEINYRSNSTIVEFTKLAGYSPNLKSYSPDLRLSLLASVPTQKPYDWPNELYWSSEWAKLLDPDYPTVCFVYDDQLSSQINDFEAEAATTLIWLLNGRLADRLLNECAPDGSIRSPSTTPYTPKDFWNKAVGVVTPHRAQMAKIIYRLQRIFPTHTPEGIRSAVDTVERFQGQERDIIIASFGLGDPDIISAEDEFLYNLNRFNVLTSRARAKLIVFVTRSLLEHLSDDIDVLEESRLLKQFAESYCVSPQQIQLGFVKCGTLESRIGILRRK